MNHSEETGHAGHAHAGEAGEAFPRVLLGGLVAGQLRREQARARWQTLFMTVGLALLALGLPTTRLLGEGPGIVRLTAGDAWVHVHLALMPVVKALSFLPGLGAERAWFLVAALCWAATYPVLQRTCRELGASRFTAMVSALVTLAAPVVWLAGTLPGPSAPGFLASAVLMRALLGPWRSEHAQARPLAAERLPLVWLGASLINLTLVLLYPAVAWAVLRSQRAEREDPSMKWGAIGRVLQAPAVLAAGFALAAWLLPTTFDGRDFLRRGWYLITGNAEQPISNILAYALILAPSLGVGVVGLWHLAQSPRGAGDGGTRGPSWIWIWCLFPFAVQALLGRPNLDLATLVLAPILTLGLADWLGRIDAASGLGRRYRLLVFSQAVVLVSFALALRHADPEREWTRWIRGELMRGDLVLTRSRAHQYLLEHRLGTEAVYLDTVSRLPAEERPAWWAALGERVQAASAARRRVLLERSGAAAALLNSYRFERELGALDLLAPIVRLDPSRR